MGAPCALARGMVMGVARGPEGVFLVHTNPGPVAASLRVHAHVPLPHRLSSHVHQERKAARKAIEQKEGKLAALNATIKPGEFTCKLICRLNVTQVSL